MARRRYRLALCAALGIALGGCRAPARAADQAAAPPPGYDLALSFDEEFNGRALDHRRWTTLYADPDSRDRSIVKRTLANNEERQIFVDPGYLRLGLNPFRVADGVLTISAAPLDPRALEAVRVDLAGQAPAVRQDRRLRGIAYGSGMISGRGRFAQRYGYFEARLRWTGAKGLWPGFWLLPQSSAWPPEIDIMEALGHERGVVYSSIHSKLAPRDVTKRVDFAGTPEEFHRFGALWMPDRIDYYIDGRKTVSIPTSADMTEPMYMLVTLAVGGKWPGDPAPDQPWPARLQIDYVKAWRFVTPPKPGGDAR